MDGMDDVWLINERKSILDKRNNSVERQRASQRSVIRSQTTDLEVSNVIWLKLISLALKKILKHHITAVCAETQNLHHASIIARGRGCSTWWGMLNSLQKSIVLHTKSLRRRIQRMRSACTNTVVGCAYTESKSWPIPSDSRNISPSSSPWLSVITDFLMSLLWRVSRYFTPSFWLSKPRGGSLFPPADMMCLLHIHWQYFTEATGQEEMQNFVRLYKNIKPLPGTWFQHTSIVSLFLFFKTVRLCAARGFLVSWFWKWMPLCFGLDPLNNLLCNYILCKSLCVHSGPFGILCCIAVTTRALTKSKLKPTL